MPPRKNNPVIPDEESDDGLSDTEDVQVLEDTSLDNKFTSKQLEILHDAKEDYIEAAPSAKAEVSNRIAEQFATAIEGAGKRLSKKERRNLMKVSHMPEYIGRTL